MKRKGITPIIAIIVLLLITVALAGLAFTFLSGVMTSQIEGSFLVSTNGIFCDSIGTNNQITIVIRNLGLSTTLDINSFIIASVIGPDNTTFINATTIVSPSPVISPGDAKPLVTNCGGSCDSGFNRIRLSTGTSTSENVVRCS